jgi:hypothetical protein
VGVHARFLPEIRDGPTADQRWCLSRLAAKASLTRRPRVPGTRVNG